MWVLTGLFDLSCCSFGVGTRSLCPHPLAHWRANHFPWFHRHNSMACFYTFDTSRGGLCFCPVILSFRLKYDDRLWQLNQACQ